MTHNITLPKVHSTLGRVPSAQKEETTPPLNEEVRVPRTPTSRKVLKRSDRRQFLPPLSPYHEGSSVEELQGERILVQLPPLQVPSLPQDNPSLPSVAAFYGEESAEFSLQIYGPSARSGKKTPSPLTLPVAHGNCLIVRLNEPSLPFVLVEGFISSFIEALVAFAQRHFSVEVQTYLISDAKTCDERLESGPFLELSPKKVFGKPQKKIKNFIESEILCVPYIFGIIFKDEKSADDYDHCNNLLLKVSWFLGSFNALMKLGFPPKKTIDTLLFDKKILELPSPKAVQVLVEFVYEILAPYLSRGDKIGLSRFYLEFLEFFSFVLLEKNDKPSDFVCFLSTYMRREYTGLDPKPDQHMKNRAFENKALVIELCKSFFQGVKVFLLSDQVDASFLSLLARPVDISDHRILSNSPEYSLYTAFRKNTLSNTRAIFLRFLKEGQGDGEFLLNVLSSLKFIEGVDHVFLEHLFMRLALSVKSNSDHPFGSMDAFGEIFLRLLKIFETYQVIFLKDDEKAFDIEGVSSRDPSLLQNFLEVLKFFVSNIGRYNDPINDLLALIPPFVSSLAGFLKKNEHYREGLLPVLSVFHRKAVLFGSKKIEDQVAEIIYDVFRLPISSKGISSEDDPFKILSLLNFLLGMSPQISSFFEQRKTDISLERLYALYQDGVHEPFVSEIFLGLREYIDTSYEIFRKLSKLGGQEEDFFSLLAAFQTFLSIYQNLFPSSQEFSPQILHAFSLFKDTCKKFKFLKKDKLPVTSVSIFFENCEKVNFKGKERVLWVKQCLIFLRVPCDIYKKKTKNFSLEEKIKLEEKIFLYLPIVSREISSCLTKDIFLDHSLTDLDFKDIIHSFLHHLHLISDVISASDLHLYNLKFSFFSDACALLIQDLSENIFSVKKISKIYKEIVLEKISSIKRIIKDIRKEKETLELQISLEETQRRWEILQNKRSQKNRSESQKQAEELFFHLFAYASQNPDQYGEACIEFLKNNSKKLYCNICADAIFMQIPMLTSHSFLKIWEYIEKIDWSRNSTSRRVLFYEGFLKLDSKDFHPRMKKQVDDIISFIKPEEKQIYEKKQVYEKKNTVAIPGRFQEDPIYRWVTYEIPTGKYEWIWPLPPPNH